METNLQEMEQKLAGIMQGWSLREVMNRYADTESIIPNDDLIPFQGLTVLSKGIWMERTRGERDERIRKEALELWESDREEEKLICFDLVSGEKGYQFTDRDSFITECVKQNNSLTELLTAELTEETKEYIRTETAGFTDRQIIAMFDPATSGSYKFFDDVKYGLFMSIYMARRSDELREKIIAMFKESIHHELASSHALNTPAEYDKAYKEFFIPEDRLQVMAGRSLSGVMGYDIISDAHSTFLLRKQYAQVNSRRKRKTYPADFITTGGPVEKYVKAEGICINENFTDIYRGTRNREIDCKINFTKAQEQEMEIVRAVTKVPYVPDTIEELDRKYDIPKDKASFVYDVVNAIGSCMKAQDDTYTVEEARKGNKYIAKEYEITVGEILKYMRGDLSARIGERDKADIVKAIECAGDIKVRIQKIRTMDSYYTIEERMLEYTSKEIFVNGHREIVWQVRKVPPFYRFALMLGYYRKQTMIKADAGPRRITQSRKSHIIINGLEDYVAGYGKKREFIEINYDTVVKNWLGENVLLEIMEKRDKRLRIYRMIDKAAEDLKRRKVIKDYEIETKLFGQKHIKKLKLYPFEVETKKSYKKRKASPKKRKTGK